MADLDDLDEFLYGETDDLQPLGVLNAITTSNTSNTAPITAPIDTDDHVFIDSAMVDRDEDDDDDDDDIDIVLDASIQSPAAYDTVNESLVTLKPGEHRSVNNPIQTTTSDLPSSLSSSSIPNLNFDTIDQLALYENQPITDISLESFTDKPWRKPGEDISDYFNFGFNEETWKMYCDRQRHLREEQTQMKRRFTGTVNTATTTTTNMSTHPSLPPIPRPHPPTHMPVSYQQPFLPHAPALQPSLNPPPMIQGLPTNLPPNIKLRTQDHQQLPTQPAPAMPVQQQKVFAPKQPASAAKPVIQQQPSTGGGLASRLKLRAPIAGLVKTEAFKPAAHVSQRSTPTSNGSTELLPGRAGSNDATQ